MKQGPRKEDDPEDEERLKFLEDRYQKEDEEPLKNNDSV